MGIVVDSSLWSFVLHGSYMNALNVKKRNFFFFACALQKVTFRINFKRILLKIHLKCKKFKNAK